MDRNHRRFAMLAAAALLASTPALAKDGSFTAQSSAGETGNGEDGVQRTVNTSFAFDHVFRAGTDQSRNMLYEQRISSERALDAESPVSELTVTARDRGNGDYGQVLWTIHDNGNEGEALGAYYRTTVWGCCGGENAHRWYWTWTGKLAFTATAEPLHAAIPNTPVDYAFAYLSSYAMDGFDREKYPRGAGLITIADGDRVVDRVLIEADENSGFEWTPMLEFSDPTGEREPSTTGFDLWAFDGKPDPAGVTGFDLVLSWDPEMGGYARIPVVAGKFDLEHAELPDSVQLRRLGN